MIDWFDNLGRFLVKRRVTVIVAVLAFTALAASRLPELTFDFTPQALFDNADAASEFSARIRETFGDDSNTIFIVWRSSDPTPGSIFSTDNLQGIRELTAELENWKHTRRVISLANLQWPTMTRIGGIDLPGLEPLIADDTVTDADATRVRDAVQGQRLFERVLVSKDENKSILLVEMQPPARHVKVLFEALRDLRGRFEKWEQLPGKPSISLSGMPAVRVDIITELQDEQLRFIPLASGFSLILLLFMFRRLSGVVLPMGAVSLAIIWLLAFLAVRGEPFNIITNALPTLLLIIGLSDGIHLLSRMAEEIRAGRPRAEAIRETVRHIGLACLLTSFTTAIGFAALIVSRTSILQTFGLTAALGVLFAYVATLLFIPPFLVWMRPPDRSSMQADRPALLERILGAICHRVVLKYPVPIVVFSVTLAVSAVIAATQITVDAHLLETFPDDHPTTQLTREVERDFSGVVSMQISIEAREAGFFEKPENLHKIEELQDRIKALDPDYVGTTSSIVDLLNLIGDAFRIDRDAVTAKQIGQALEVLRKRMPETISEYIDEESRHVLVLIRMRDFGAHYGIQRTTELLPDIERLFGEGASVGIISGAAPTANLPITVRFAGDGYLAGVGLISLVRDLLGTIGLAAVLIFIAMTVLFRSLRIGLISVLPNVLPLALTFGVMTILGMHLSTTTAIVFSIGLGLAVDDTVHFLARYLEERQRTGNVRDAIQRSYLGVGRAMGITTIVIIGGMVVLLQTTFMPIKYLAILMSIIVAGALIGDLLLLPALLLLFDRTSRTANPRTTHSGPGDAVTAEPLPITAEEIAADIVASGSTETNPPDASAAKPDSAPTADAETPIQPDAKESEPRA